MRGFLSIYLILDAILILVSFFMGGVWLINTQMAFISSMLILFSSFYSYKSLVKNTNLNFSKDDFDGDDKDIIKKTKKITNTFKSALSPFRLLSYGFLILSFLILNKHELLNIRAFFIGLGVLPIGSLILGFKMSKV